jgi:hypothetical protein
VIAVGKAVMVECPEGSLGPWRLVKPVERSHNLVVYSTS